MAFEAYLAFVAVDEDGMVRSVEDDGERGGDVALRDRDEWVLVRLDADLEVLDAVFEQEAFVERVVRLRDEGPRQAASALNSLASACFPRRVPMRESLQDRLETQCFHKGKVLGLRVRAAVDGRQNGMEVFRRDQTPQTHGHLVRQVKPG